MKIISIANQKGGVGKSTVTILLACQLAADGNEVLILDTDTQSTIFELSEIQENEKVTVLRCKPKDVFGYIERLKGFNCDYCFIDLPRFTDKNKESIKVLFLCDLVLIPVLGGLIELLSIKAFLKALAVIKQSNKDFDYYAFLNRMSRKTEDKETIEILKDKCKMMDNQLKDLKIFRTPSLTTPMLSSKEGRRRFEKFYNEFKTIIKVQSKY